MEASNSQNILPACLLPRRRFVRWCLLTFFLFNLVCVMVRFYAVHHPDWSVLWGDLELVGLMFLLVFAPLLIPVRTKRGSLLQVSGLFFVLLSTLLICCEGWESEPTGDCGLSRIGYGIAVVMMVGGTFLYVYLPVWLLHLIISFIEKRRASVEPVRHS